MLFGRRCGTSQRCDAPSGVGPIRIQERRPHTCRSPASSRSCSRSSLEKVLSWSRFRDQSTDLRHLRASRMRLQPAMVAGKATSPSVLSSTDEDDDSAFKLAIAVPQPGVKYTVPQSLLGWKGRAEEGEDPDAWYDARGRRKGPPLNYWRQSMDERIHGQCMDAIQEIIDEADDHDGTPRPMLDALLRGLEGRMSIVKPMCNRKLLGRWAPIVLDGIVVARTAPEADSRVGAREAMS